MRSDFIVTGALISLLCESGRLGYFGNLKHLAPLCDFPSIDLQNITSLNDLLATAMAGCLADAYAQCGELDGWDIYAV